MFFSDFVQKFRNIKQLPVDLKTIMNGLSSLVLSSQEVMFSPHMYVFIHDPSR